jgi:hypothetical protein
LYQHIIVISCSEYLKAATDLREPLTGWTMRHMCTQKEQQGSYMDMAMAVPIEILKGEN